MRDVSTYTENSALSSLGKKSILKYVKIEIYMIDINNNNILKYYCFTVFFYSSIPKI